MIDFALLGLALIGASLCQAFVAFASIPVCSRFHKCCFVRITYETIASLCSPGLTVTKNKMERRTSVNRRPLPRLPRFPKAMNKCQTSHIKPDLSFFYTSLRGCGRYCGKMSGLSGESSPFLEHFVSPQVSQESSTSLENGRSPYLSSGIRHCWTHPRTITTVAFTTRGCASCSSEFILAAVSSLGSLGKSSIRSWESRLVGGATMELSLGFTTFIVYGPHCQQNNPDHYSYAMFLLLDVPFATTSLSTMMNLLLCSKYI